MVKIEDLRLMNEATIIYRKKQGLDVKINELISEIINDDACFFKLEKEDAYMILEDIGVERNKIPEVYSKMIREDEFLKLERLGRITKKDSILDLDELYNVDVFKNRKNKMSDESSINDSKKEEQIENKEIAVIKKNFFEKILEKIRYLRHY